MNNYDYYYYYDPQITTTNLVIQRKYHWKRKSGSADRCWEAYWRAWRG